jgi:serine/threonine protein kinase
LDSGFDKIRRNSSTLFTNKDFRNDNLEQILLTDEKELQDHYQLTPVRSSPFARVDKFSVTFDGFERNVYLKQYLDRSTWDFIKHLVRPSRAKRAFKATLMLERNGFEAPVVVAMGEYKSTFLERGNFLVTLEVEGAKQIYQFIPESSENLSTEQLRGKRKLIRAFGRTVGRMHAAGIFHGDLKLVNVLARQEENVWCFFFIDNERTTKFRNLPAWLRLKNLVQLNMFRGGISDTDHLRFFKAYLEENPSIASDRNIWARKITSKTAERFSEMLSRGRIRK